VIERIFEISDQDRDGALSQVRPRLLRNCSFSGSVRPDPHLLHCRRSYPGCLKTLTPMLACQMGSWALSWTRWVGWEGLFCAAIIKQRAA
jgi:hypothetical protein